MFHYIALIQYQSFLKQATSMISPGPLNFMISTLLYTFQIWLKEKSEPSPHSALRTVDDLVRSVQIGQPTVQRYILSMKQRYLAVIRAKSGYIFLIVM